MDKIKVSLSRNFGTENLAMTAEISKTEIPEFSALFRESVIEQYKSVMGTAIPEAKISGDYAEERSQALKKQADQLEELRKESERLTKEEKASKKLVTRYVKK